MGVRRARGKAWGNALGGYKKQKRVGGKFSSGFVGSVGSPSLTPAARRAQFVERKSVRDRRRKTAKKVAIGAGVVALGAGAAYAAGQSPTIRKKVVEGRLAAGLSADVARQHVIPSVKGHAKVKSEFVKKKAAKAQDVVNAADASTKKALTISATAVTAINNVEKVNKSIKRLTGKEEVGQTGVGRAVEAPRALMSSVSASESAENAARIARNQRMAELKAQRHAIHQKNNSFDPEKQNVLRRSAAQGEIFSEAERRKARRQEYINGRTGPVGIQKFNPQTKTYETIHIPSNYDVGARNPNSTTRRPAEGELGKFMNGEAAKEGSFAGGDWLEGIDSPRVFDKNSRGVLADTFGEGTSHLPQATASRTVRAVNLPAAGRRRKASVQRVSASSQGVPKLMRKKGIIASPVTDFDDYGFGLDPVSEKRKNRSLSAGMKDKNLRRALREYQEEYGPIDPGTGETHGGPIPNIADLIELKSRNPRMSREDFLHKPPQERKDSPTPENLRGIIQQAGRSETVGLERFKGRSFVPIRSTDDDVYYKHEKHVLEGRKKDRKTLSKKEWNEWEKLIGIPALNVTGGPASANELASLRSAPDGLEIIPFSSPQDLWKYSRAVRKKGRDAEW